MCDGNKKILFRPIRLSLVPLQLPLKKPLEQERLLQAQSGDPLPGEGATVAQEIPCDFFGSFTWI